MINWRLKDLLLEHNIANSKALQSILREQVGVQLSNQALHQLITTQPAQLRLQTADFICTALQVPLQSYLTISPNQSLEKPVGIIKPYSTVKSIEHHFTDPSLLF